MTRSKVLGASVIALCAILLRGVPLPAADKSPQPILNHATAFAAGRVTVNEAPEPWNLHLVNPPHVVPMPHMGRVVDPVEQRPGAGPANSEFNQIYNVLGVGQGFPNYHVSSAPPDTTLAVGTTEVVQWVDLSYADFDKSTGAIIPLNGADTTPGSAVWQALLPGSQCANNNSGDIIVKFDRDAQRWILAQNVFTEPYEVCVAVSQTATFSDNLWYAYQFPVVNSGFPDYPKWGVWSSHGDSDGYYQNWNNFGPGLSGFWWATAAPSRSASSSTRPKTACCLRTGIRRHLLRAVRMSSSSAALAMSTISTCRCTPCTSTTGPPAMPP
jgi:hypothetical protein